MRRFLVVAVLGLAPFLATSLLRAAGEPPAWAYAIPPAPAAGAARGAAPAAPAAPDTSIKTLPGAAQGFTNAQIRDGFGPADWWPGDHPTMPEVVAKGRRPDVRACSLCHYPNGKGRPENAGVSGLPVSYFIQQMNDYRNDLRKSGEPRKGNTNIMITIAKGMTPEEIKAAAEYFGSMKWTPWITVKEVATVPRMRSQAGLWVPVEPAATEPLGMRIIETPDDVERSETFRDPRAGFTAYVPVGSVKRGETLVKTGGNGRTVACGSCHGADMNGMGPVPGLAGRSPSYLTRQMYDMQVDARKGEWAALMKPVVDTLTDEDFINISAYLASLPTAAPASRR